MSVLLLASTRYNLDINLIELLLRKVEKLVATQDQYSILLDNMLGIQKL
jgi:hypothetical protein